VCFGASGARCQPAGVTPRRHRQTRRKGFRWRWTRGGARARHAGPHAAGGGLIARRRAPCRRRARPGYMRRLRQLVRWCEAVQSAAAPRLEAAGAGSASPNIFGLQLCSMGRAGAARAGAPPQQAGGLPADVWDRLKRLRRHSIPASGLGPHRRALLQQRSLWMRLPGAALTEWRRACDTSRRLHALAGPRSEHSGALPAAARGGGKARHAPGRAGARGGGDRALGSAPSAGAPAAAPPQPLRASRPPAQGRGPAPLRPGRRDSSSRVAVRARAALLVAACGGRACQRDCQLLRCGRGLNKRRTLLLLCTSCKFALAPLRPRLPAARAAGLGLKACAA
jgi:hypothetical protein